MQVPMPPSEVVKRKRWLGRVEWIMWAALGMLELLLGLRLAINLFSPNPNSGFVLAITGITRVIIAPIGSLMRMSAFEDSVYEITTLAAMAAYVVVFWIILGMNGSMMARTERMPTRSTLSM